MVAPNEGPELMTRPPLLKGDGDDAHMEDVHEEEVKVVVAAAAAAAGCWSADSGRLHSKGC